MVTLPTWKVTCKICVVAHGRARVVGWLEGWPCFRPGANWWSQGRGGRQHLPAIWMAVVRCNDGGQGRRASKSRVGTVMPVTGFDGLRGWWPMENPRDGSGLGCCRRREGDERVQVIQKVFGTSDGAG